MSHSELDPWLQAFLGRHQGVSGTIHRLESEVLVLAAHRNIPPPVVQIVQHIPKGKGMAGLAWERNAPVSTCNLQTDKSGDVRPGARAVAAGAAAALPVHDAKGELRAVVGIAFANERDLSDDDLAALNQDAENLPV